SAWTTRRRRSRREPCSTRSSCQRRRFSMRLSWPTTAATRRTRIYRPPRLWVTWRGNFITITCSRSVVTRRRARACASCASMTERGPEMAAEAKVPSLDQQRANHAWHAVQRVLEKHKNDREKAKKVGGQARKLPTRIIASGLGQALAFLKAKDYAPDLLIALSDWVLNKPKDPAGTKPLPEDKALLLKIIQGDADFLRRATDEALAYLMWLTRFAEAEKLTETE